TRPAVRVALPDHLILGGTTFVRTHRALGGPPVGRRHEGAETMVFYGYTWYAGCEGGCLQTFTWQGLAGPQNPYERFPLNIETRTPNRYAVCDSTAADGLSC